MVKHFEKKANKGKKVPPIEPSVMYEEFVYDDKHLVREVNTENRRNIPDSVYDKFRKFIEGEQQLVVSSATNLMQI